jgi:formate transporter
MIEDIEEAKEPNVVGGHGAREAVDNYSPPPDYVRSNESTILNLLDHGSHLEQMSLPKLIVAGLMAGCLITFGAALSVLLSTGIEQEGIARLFTSFGFIVGFSAVIFSRAALFTEINVVVPLVVVKNLSDYTSVCRKCIWFWAAVFICNGLGAILVGIMMRGVDTFAFDADLEHLQLVINKKNVNIQDGVQGWFTVILSGMMGNWLVGMAAYFASKARTLPGKFIGIALPVTAFVTLGVQHSPANMGYMSIGMVSSLNQSLNDLSTSSAVNSLLLNNAAKPSCRHTTWLILKMRTFGILFLLLLETFVVRSHLS